MVTGDRPARRILIPLLIATFAMAGLQWMDWFARGADRGNPTAALWFSGGLAANVVLTLWLPRIKRDLVTALQRYVINPPVRLLLHLGLMPLGYALIETRGRTTGKPRRTPVGNGRVGDTFWIVAEHGYRSGYVRNIRRDPRVRLRMRVGWRFRWVEGRASLHPEMDPAALQRTLSAWHPLRALNAMQVQVLGSQLLVVKVELGQVSDQTCATVPATSSSSVAPVG